MLGFLAAILTILISLARDPNLRRYAQRGLLDHLFLFYLLTIASLLITFALSVATFAKEIPILVFHLMLMSFLNSFAQTALISLAFFNIARRSFAASIRS